MTTLTNSQNDLQYQVDKINANYVTLNGAFGSHEQSASVLENRLTTLETTQSGLTSSVNTLNTTTADLSAEVTTINTN